jgi:hypothetical protein
MYVMLLVGMVAAAWCSAAAGQLQRDPLIQVIQGAAVVTMALNIVALWKQEARDPSRAAAAPNSPSRASFRESLAPRFARRAAAAMRFLVAVGLGTAAFNMQDIILEPYGGDWPWAHGARCRRPAPELRSRWAVRCGMALPASPCMDRWAPHSPAPPPATAPCIK